MSVVLRESKALGISAPKKDAIITHSSSSIRHGRKRKMALLLPAHNEELIIKATIQSAIKAGQAKRDIFVVNDNSMDNTRAIATAMLGKANVLNVKRSGKALAVRKAIKKFEIEKRYEWIHIADADSIFSANYFKVYKSKLDPKKYAVAIGFVQSLKGNWIGSYRALSYTYGQNIDRRIQASLKMITVFPGPVTCLRTDIISELQFDGPSLTEDFDITLQVHRKKLGDIIYIPRAVNYTQDPQTVRDFCKQNMRWMRGYFQGVKKYKIGLGGQRIDISIGFQMLQTLFFLLQVFVLVPYILIVTHGNWLVILSMILVDFTLNGFITLIVAGVAKRWSIIGVIPYFYFLRLIEIGAHVIAFIEIFFLKRFQEKTVGWSTAGRRYKISNAAMLEVVK